MIVVAGEALADMVASQNHPQIFTAIPGGSAFNVACALGLLGLNTGFVCPISKDYFGQLLLKRLEECQATALVQPTVDALTPLALVTVDENNQPHYAFHREGTADRLVNQLPMEKILPKETQILHITGFCLNEAEDYHHWIKLVMAAKSNGAIISVDPNVRENLISDPDDYRRRIHALIAIADIVKVSDEDLLYLQNHNDLEAAAKELSSMVKLAIVTYGADGARAFRNQDVISVPGIKVSRLMDTIGAGDCFSAAYLYGLHHLVSIPDALSTLSTDSIQQVLKFAAQAAAINCGRKGCQPPTAIEIKSQLAQHTHYKQSLKQN